MKDKFYSTTYSSLVLLASLISYIPYNLLELSASCGGVCVDVLYAGMRISNKTFVVMCRVKNTQERVRRMRWSW